MTLARALSSVTIALAACMAAGSVALAQNPAQALRPGDHILGEEDAALVMVEYASFACGHCAHFQEAAWPVIKEEFVDTGQVRWVLRPMLTNPIPLAGAGMIIADCAPDDRYFDAADLLFTEQSTIFDAARSGGDVLGAYNRIGAAVGLSEEAIMACLNDPAMNEMVNQAAMQADTDGIPGTPSFIVRGRLLTQEPIDGSYYFTWGGEPLIINGERVPAQLDGDTFRRIVLHFLDMPASGH